MSKALSNDLRRRIVQAVDGGMSCRAAATRFQVAPSTVVRLIGRWRRHHSYAPSPRGGDKRSGRIEAFRDDILSQIDAQVDITLAEIAGYLQRVHGVRFSLSTIWRFLDRHKQTYKKNRARQRAGSARRRRPARHVATLSKAA